MSLARDSIVLSDYLYTQGPSVSHFVRNLLATQRSKVGKTLKTYLGEAKVTLSDEFLKWINSGPTGIQIGSIIFNGLPPGVYTVEGYSNNLVSEAVSGEFNYKILFNAPLFVDGTSQKPLALSLNTVSLPISINSPQPTLNLILRVEAYSLKSNFRCEEEELAASNSSIADEPPTTSFSAVAVFVRKSLT